MTLTVHLLILLFISGVVTENESDVYCSSTSLCALKGTIVNISCTYKYIVKPQTKYSFWTEQWSANDAKLPNLLDDPGYKDRVQNYKEKQHNCTLRLKNVREEDESECYFRFTPHRSGGRYQGTDEVDLSVTDLQVEGPERVMEGGNVTLTCNTTCSLTVRPTFTWYRDGDRLSSSTDQLLHLQPVSRKDAGRYHCSAQDRNATGITLNVRYGPKNVSVSISPSGEIVEGSSVTLTCSSDADPPVDCIWFKGASLVANGETYTLQISSVDSGEYKCKCSNGYIVKYSEAVSLNVLYGPKTVNVSISPSGEIVEGSSVNLTCSSDANPPVQKYTWFKKLDKGIQQKSTSQNYSISNISSADSGEYRCMANNTRGSRSSEYMSLTVLYAPKKVQVSISDTAEDSSVTLICSSDANPPVQNYTWYKEGGGSPVGSGSSYSPLPNGSYYCVVQNEYGSQKSDAVTVPVKAFRSVRRVGLFAVLGGVAGCGCLIVIISVLFRRKKSPGNSATASRLRQDEITTTPDPDSSNRDEVLYATVVPQRVTNPRNAESSAVTASALDTFEEVQYASIQHWPDEVVGQAEGDDVQYATVRFTTNRSAVSTLDDVTYMNSTNL